MFRLALACFVVCGFAFCKQDAVAEPKIKFCTVGVIKLDSFREHIDYLRHSRRYSTRAIDELVAKQKAGGPDFYTSQVVVKEEQSSSGDYDLGLLQGHSDPKTSYEAAIPWRCEQDDYPVVYFIGFEVREIGDRTILVSRKKGAANVISLKTIDPALGRPLRVRDAKGGGVLCRDIRTGCVAGIFYGRY